MAILVVLPAAAAGREVRFFEISSQDEFLEGVLEGIAIDPLGNLSLADRARRVADLGEPFLLSAAPHPEGWVVGTGNNGVVLLVNRDGTVSTLFEAPEPEIFAVWADGSGTVLAGSSPNGKVYRIRDGIGEEVFDPEETYIWDVAGLNDGSLLVGTGTDGKLYRMNAAGATEVLFESEDTHIRKFKVLKNGDILLGTAGEGLILRLSKDGQEVRTLFDADQPEVVSFAEAEDGTCYAAVLASEASWVDLSRPAPGQAQTGANQDGEPNDNGAEVRVTVTPKEPQVGSAQTGTRPSGFQGPRSEILKISPEGTVESVVNFGAETVYAISWQRGRLWIGTGLEGKIFSWRDGTRVLEKDLDERQVIAVLEGSFGPVYATTNAAAVFATTGEPERSGLYTSPVLDAGAVSDFGTLRWTGTLAKGAAVGFSARTGMSSRPDRTWSSWSPEAAGEEVGLSEVPSGRYLQWRGRLKSGNGVSPGLSRVSVSYKQQNLRPVITKLDVLAPGEVIVPSGFSAGAQTFEPSRPDKNGIFSPLKAAKSKNDRPRKTLWKRGYRTLSWEARDPNEDKLTYSLMFRREDPVTEWLPMGEDVPDSFLSFDATALPDGVYRFKLVAADRPESDRISALTTDRTSEPVYVDHSAPVLGKRTRGSEGLEVKIRDEMNPLREAVYSVDAKEWLPAALKDGLLDGVEETVVIPVPENAEQLLLLRVSDTAHNVATFDLSGELQ